MDHRASSAIFLALFLLVSAASAFNITKLLSQYPDFTNFNDYLTQTKLADDINSRETITILAVDNGAISALSGKPSDVVKKILSVHVILDYYDVHKLNKLSTDNATLLTTLFQTSGAAANQQGFVKVSHINGEVAFGSAVQGAQLDSKLVKSVAAQPYNISVLQITTPIQVPGIDSKASPPSPSSPVEAPKKAPSKSPAPSAKTPSQADEPVAAPVDDTPKTHAPSPHDAPVTSPPKPSDTVDDAASPGPSDSSSASRVSFVGGAAIMGLISSLLAL